MNKIEQMVRDLDAAVTELYESYVKSHEDLKPYTETTLTDETAGKANVILKDIQDKFGELYHAYYWILHRSEYASNAVNSYNAFIENLKANGAKLTSPEGSIITAPEEAQG